jgi:hypothetical protein
MVFASFGAKRSTEGSYRTGTLSRLFVARDERLIQWANDAGAINCLRTNRHKLAWQYWAAGDAEAWAVD